MLVYVISFSGSIFKVTILLVSLYYIRKWPVLRRFNNNNVSKLVESSCLFFASIICQKQSRAPQIVDQNVKRSVSLSAYQ